MQTTIHSVGGMYAYQVEYRNRLQALGFKFKQHYDKRYKDKWQQDGEATMEVNTVEDIIEIIKIAECDVIISFNDGKLRITLYDDYIE